MPIRPADRLVALLVCTCFFAFLAWRAVRVPLTYDEAASYLKFVRADWLSLFNFTWATNHLLNTVLAKFFCLAGGDSELALRLPGLIGYGVWAWFAVLILRDVSSRAIALAGLLLLNLNPYLIDYFALSRGYGLWLGLQMAMLYFLIRFVGLLCADQRVEASRALSRALTCAIGAVLANVAALNLYLSVLVIATLAFAVTNRRAGPNCAPPVLLRPSRFRRALPWIAAAGFSALVFSQDLRLSPQLYEPIVVKLSGLSEAESAAVRVVRTDVHNRAQDLLRADSSWLTMVRANTTGLRIDVPLETAQKIDTITVMLGGCKFVDAVRHPGGLWMARDEDGTRRFESSPSLSLPRSRLTSFQSIINYRDGGAHVLYAIRGAAIFLALLALFNAGMSAAGWIAGRSGLVRREQWRVLEFHTLWLAAIAGAPLVLLMRDAELGFGDTSSLLQGLRYLVDAQFYDRVYRPNQVDLALVGMAAATIVCVAALGIGYRRSGLARLLPAVTVLSVIVSVTAILVAERVLFNSPYPLGRTALFFVPLFVLAAILALDVICGIDRAGAGLAAAILIPAVLLAAVHFSLTANVTYSPDWPYDVDTKRMIADLARFVGGDSGSSRPPTLAVSWQYWPVASVYARWNSRARINVVEEGAPGARDFLYVRESELPPRVRAMKRYPAAGAVLAQLR
jgi:hypothetical protein